VLISQKLKKKMIHSAAVPDLISLHDPSNVNAMIDDDVLGAAKVLFGQSYMNFRNMQYHHHEDMHHQISNVSESSTSRSSSPEKMLDSYYSSGRIVVSVNSSAKQKRKAKRFEEEDEYEEVQRSPKTKAAKIQKLKEPKWKQENRNAAKRESDDDYDNHNNNNEEDDKIYERETSTKYSSNLHEVIIPNRKPAKKSSKRCDYCSATTTPMWRHGPVGYNDLCNKCGVRWMRGRILPGLTR